MEKSSIDFGQMRKETEDITSELRIPELEIGKTLNEMPLRSPGEDMKEINEKIQRTTELNKARESLGELGDDLDEKIISRIADLGLELGDDYASQRPEMQIAIARLPIIGVELAKNQNGEVENGQEITPDNLIFTRVTDHLPTDDDGTQKVLTAFEATKDTDNPVYRLTAHWTINHVVHSHTLGDFDNRRVTILVPGQDMLKTNGSPDALLPVDTFWHQDLELPESAVIFSYDNDPSGKSIILEDNDNSELIALLSMQAMGYTTVKDHPTYTETGFDMGVYNLGKKIGIEDNRLHIDMMTKETAIENFLHPGLGGEHISNALERLAVEYWQELPTEVRNATIGRLKEIAASGATIERKHDVYQALDSVIVDFMEKYEVDAKKPFIEDLPREILLDFVVSEISYWIEKDDANPGEMIENHISSLSKYLDSDSLEWIREEATKKFNS